MSAPLHSEDLTDNQWELCVDASRFPVILTTRGMSITAASLERRGYGQVEDGASGERIFRLNQDGCDAMAWLRELDEAVEADHDAAPFERKAW